MFKYEVRRSMQEQVAPTQASQSQAESAPPQSTQSQEQNAPASWLPFHGALILKLQQLWFGEEWLQRNVWGTWDPSALAGLILPKILLAGSSSSHQDAQWPASSAMRINDAFTVSVDSSLQNAVGWNELRKAVDQGDCCFSFLGHQTVSSPMDKYALKSVSDLPAPFRSTFSFRYFNSLQSECFSACFLSDVNMVISAPTGSGKTVLFELCILRLLSKFISAEGTFIHIKGTLKTQSDVFHRGLSFSCFMKIYIAPSKALVQEKLRDWNNKLGSWGINCLELTGDNESYNIRNIQEADIILTTPEKFDAVTRYRIKDGGLSFFSDIALVLIDEVHLLNDPRGAALEAIVSRIKMLSKNPEMKSSPLASVRFLAISATIPNIDDLAEWLMVPIQGIKRFGEEMRPVKLTTKVFATLTAVTAHCRSSGDLVGAPAMDILMQFSRGKSALVFCSTRKGAQEAAQRLSQIVMTFGYSNPFIKNREQQESSTSSAVGYHNGGLSLKDRNLIEGLFLNGDVQILCTTNTLAHGINLPAHTMCGRAGRPPFDDTGMVIIMTRKETVHLYENLLNGCELVESQLLSCVTEHLTAEIVQLTVSDITRAIEWMKCSYLYNPGSYAIKKGIPSNRIEKYIQEICVQKVNELTRHQMIWTDEDGFSLKPLEPGSLMTKYYLKFDTMKHIMQAPPNCSTEEALHIICRAEEISWIQLRRNEKKLLNDINADKDGRLRFHILGDKGKRKKRIQTREEKIFVLANDCLTGDPLVHDLSMNQDITSICSNGCRIAKCMKEYFLYRKNYKGALHSTLLAKSLHQKLWDDSPYLLKQLPGIGMVTAKALHSMGVKSFDTLLEADPRKIEIVTGRKYPFGNHIKDSLLSLPPKVEMKVEETECPRQGKSKLVVTLSRLSQPSQPVKRHYADMVVGVEEDNLIVFHEKIRVEEFSSPYSTTILLTSPQHGKLTGLDSGIHLIFNAHAVGIDLHQKAILIKGTGSNVIHKHGIKQVSSLPQHKDMPSFNLLDEDSEEGEPAVEDDDDCKIITERTVFDHIREKAKNLPILATSNNDCSPSLETINLIRKRNRERQHELDNLIEAFPPEEPKAVEQNRHTLNKDETPNRQFSSDAKYLASDTANLHLEPEGNLSKTLTGETIFEHIRRKAKNFPIFDERNTVRSKPFNPTKEPFAGSIHTFSDYSFDMFEEQHSSYALQNTAVNLDREPEKPCKETLFTLVEMPSLSVPLVKKEMQHQRSSPVARGNQLHSPSVSKRQCCSLATASETGEVDSFLGFKSVFSFL
ncbi:hypothetical protein LguiB_011351 [Lonicera macranthoides]